MTGHELAERRRALGLTRELASAAVGRSYRQWSRWEAGKAPVPDWLPLALDQLRQQQQSQTGDTE
jgi:transcriptional regulator with XRE-family HTH domain